MDTDLHQLADRFFLDLRLKGRSPATLRSYRWYVGQFLKYLDRESITMACEISNEVLKGYHMDLFQRRSLGQCRDAARVQPYLVPVRSFVRFMQREKLLPEDPVEDLSFPRRHRSLPWVILSADEMVRLIEAPDVSTAIGYRDRTIMELLYSTAIRRNECRSIKIPDLSIEDGLLRVFGKGQKERMVPVGRIALKFLDNYVLFVRPLFAKRRSEMHLFLSSRGSKMSRNVIGGFIDRYTRQAGIGKRVTPHTFRHTCATLMLRNRADIRHIQAMLGHESLESTQIYTHVAVSDLRDVLAKYHPREQNGNESLPGGAI